MALPFTDDNERAKHGVYRKDLLCRGNNNELSLV
jgi:hypothetical protein